MFPLNQRLREKEKENLANILTNVPGFVTAQGRMDMLVQVFDITFVNSMDLDFEGSPPTAARRIVNRLLPEVTDRGESRLAALVFRLQKQLTGLEDHWFLTRIFHLLNASVDFRRIYISHFRSANEEARATTLKNSLQELLDRTLQSQDQPLHIETRAGAGYPDYTDPNDPGYPKPPIACTHVILLPQTDLHLGAADPDFEKEIALIRTYVEYQEGTSALNGFDLQGYPLWVIGSDDTEMSRKLLPGAYFIEPPGVGAAWNDSPPSPVNLQTPLQKLGGLLTDYLKDRWGYVLKPVAAGAPVGLLLVFADVDGTVFRTTLVPALKRKLRQYAPDDTLNVFVFEDQGQLEFSQLNPKLRASDACVLFYKSKTDTWMESTINTLYQQAAGSPAVLRICLIPVDPPAPKVQEPDEIPIFDAWFDPRVLYCKESWDSSTPNQLALDKPDDIALQIVQYANEVRKERDSELAGTQQ